MAGWDWTREALSAGMAMTRDGLGGYLMQHDVDDPAPASLPGVHGESVTLYAPTAADEMAEDWRIA